MKKALFILLLCFFVSISSFGQRVDGDEIDLKFNPAGDTLIIQILDEQVKSYDLFIYKSTDEVMVNKNTSENPIKIPISEWKRAIYHIKIDYNLITQFRHIEIFE